MHEIFGIQVKTGAIAEKYAQGSRQPLRVYCTLAQVVCLLTPFAAGAQPADAVRLSAGQIDRAFANVCDRAQVQDAVGTSATNQWFADGRMTNEWSNGEHSGTITGTWYTRDDLRCVTITSGMPELENTTRCGPIYQRGAEYFSINSDGSVHGIHRLSPMTNPLQPRCKD